MAQRLFLAWMAIILAPSIANAQSPAHRDSIDLKGSIGYTRVFDDDANHLHTSAAVKLYLTDRFSIEPEVQYLRASLHDDLVIAANVNLDLRRGRVTPYVSGGIGVVNKRHLFAQGGVGTRSKRVGRGSSRRMCELAITSTSGPASDSDTLSDQRRVKVFYRLSGGPGGGVCWSALWDVFHALLPPKARYQVFRWALDASGPMPIRWERREAAGSDFLRMPRSGTGQVAVRFAKVRVRELTDQELDDLAVEHEGDGACLRAGIAPPEGVVPETD